MKDAITDTLIESVRKLQSAVMTNQEAIASLQKTVDILLKCRRAEG